MEPFHHLLDAFSQDVVKPRYASFDEVLDYCRAFGEPGRAPDAVSFGAADPENVRRSRRDLHGVQLANFWQDIAVDWAKGRLYLPQDELALFGVTEAQIAAGRVDRPWRRLMAFQAARARSMFESGAPLARALPGASAGSCDWSCKEDLRILERIDRTGGDVSGIGQCCGRPIGR